MESKANVVVWSLNLMLLYEV